jgi:hypothetical protein
MARTYHVIGCKWNNGPRDGDESVIVTDQDEKEYFDKTAKRRPIVAEFPISILHERDIQLKRAKELRDTLNAGLVAIRMNQT